MPRVFGDVAGQARQVGPALLSGQCKKGGCVLIDESDRLEVLPGQMGQVTPVEHVELDRHHGQRVAVRPRSGAVAMARDSPSPGHIDHVDPHPQVLLEVKGYQTRDSVRSATDCPGTDQRDGVAGVVGLLPAARKPDREDREEQKHSDPKRNRERQRPENWGSPLPHGRGSVFQRSRL